MWKWLIGGVVVVAGLVLWLAPLRWVVPVAAPELTAREMRGSIWRGRLSAAEWRGIDLGDIAVGIDPRGLLAGELRLDFDRAGSALVGRIATGNGAHRIERVTGGIGMALPYTWARALDVKLADVALSVDAAGRCKAASGVVTTRLAGIPMIGDSPRLQGVARCDGDALLLPLASDDGQWGVDLRVRADRGYSADVVINSRSRLVNMALAAAGFSAGGNGSVLRVEGQF